MCKCVSWRTSGFQLSHVHGKHLYALTPKLKERVLKSLLEDVSLTGRGGSEDGVGREAPATLLGDQ